MVGFAPALRAVQVVVTPFFNCPRNTQRNNFISLSGAEGPDCAALNYVFPHTQLWRFRVGNCRPLKTSLNVHVMQRRAVRISAMSHAYFRTGEILTATIMRVFQLDSMYPICGVG